MGLNLSTVVCASARSAAGHQSASTVVSALRARSAVAICEHRRSALVQECVGWNLRARSWRSQGVRWV